MRYQFRGFAEIYIDIQNSYTDLQRLENQLRTLTISNLEREIISLIDVTDSFLFPYPGWWQPNMIEGLPPVKIPSSYQRSDEASGWDSWDGNVYQRSAEALTRLEDSYSLALTRLEASGWDSWDGNVEEVEKNTTPQALILTIRVIGLSKDTR